MRWQLDGTGAIHIASTPGVCLLNEERKTMASHPSHVSGRRRKSPCAPALEVALV